MFVLVQMIESKSAPHIWFVDRVWGPFDSADEAQMVAEQQSFLWVYDPDDDDAYQWIVKELH